MIENRPESLSGEDKIALILRSCDVDIMTIGARIGGFNDWSYETPETIAKAVWRHTELNFTDEDPLFLPIYAYTDDRIFQFNPLIKEGEDRRLLLLKFCISRGKVKFKVQVESSRQSEQILMPLDQVFELAMNR